ncbi:hypothetical protein [Tamlana crocina]|uniref:Glycerophosphoryl diester phosphodiesterase membrane domain-containing protein n=1 Tax=Tamlana crocina TaxID=393006 RepID=A0ABX1DE31_9FLAO|nr:hypothetical protein [Tamlana crocina]NJX15964.1 hypothetical protein [Tamlana crocina]
MDAYNRLLHKIENAKPLEFSNIFDNIIELFKKVWLKGFLMVLIMVGIAMLVGGVFSLIGLSPKGNPFAYGINLEAYLDFYSSSIIQNIPQTILTTTVSLALISAFYKICIQFDAGKQQVVEDYFQFFKKDYFSKLLMLGIIHTGIATVAQLLFFIPYIYAAVPLAYFPIVFANNPELSEMEIVKASFALGNKKWLFSFGMLFVAGLLGFLGILGCGIGILFTISIVYLPTFFIYKEVVGFDDTNEIDLIGEQNDIDF